MAKLEEDLTKDRGSTLALTALWGKSHTLEMNSDQPLGHSELVDHNT